MIFRASPRLSVLVRLLASVLLLAPAVCCVSAQTAPRATDPEIERRVDALIRQMTVEEKVGQLSQYTSNAPETLELVRRGHVGSLFNVLGAQDVNPAQRIAVEQTRLKIPLLFGYDVIHGYRTIFPIPLATAASFDPAMIEQIERVAAREAAAAGVKWTFAPMVDIARDPRWGRIVEGAGEDPYLDSVVAAARVRGFQGNNISDADRVVACAKHFAAYGAVEGGRDYNTVDISEQLLREIYLPPFQAAVRAGAGTIMAAFEDLNGVPAAANAHLLTDILRNEWHFQGLVDSDYGAVHELIVHGVAADDREAAVKALTAGLDMDMADGAYQALLSVPARELPMERLNEAVRRVLRLKFEAGLFDRPFVDPGRERTAELTPENLQIARRAAQESMVLLKNENGILPLSKSMKTLAVIGPLADDKADQLGSWAGQGRAEDAVTPLEGIKAKLPQLKVLYAKGVDIPSFEKEAPQTTGAPAPTTATGVRGTATDAGPDGIDRAVQAARSADVVLILLGELAQMTGEASSRAHLTLPGRQEELLEQVVATGKPVVLVLESGRPLDIRWANEHVGAILQAWHPGVQAGNAIADILFGDASPSARLPLTWPRTVGQIPVYYNHKSTGRPASPDRWHTGYLDESPEPLFPFGYGLTYTSFRYRNIRVLNPVVRASGTVQVEAEIENVGRRTGTEVVQLYVHDRVAPTSRPVRELKGFERVTLNAGEKRTVVFSLPTNDLGSYDTRMRWVVPAGTYDVWIAPNAQEGIVTTFQVQSSTLEPEREGKGNGELSK
ncbi:MAG: beta-glucosidase BglX [Acidobacteria bacterium]|nr:beta-glucosidase BglX [Acidobacteriota bacterium]